MKGIGINTFKKGADEAVRRLTSGEQMVTDSIRGFRFWAALDWDDSIGEHFDIYAMDEESHMANIITGTYLGNVWYEGEATHYIMTNGEKMTA